MYLQGCVCVCVCPFLTPAFHSHSSQCSHWDILIVVAFLAVSVSFREWLFKKVNSQHKAMLLSFCITEQLSSYCVHQNTYFSFLLYTFKWKQYSYFGLYFTCIFSTIPGSYWLKLVDTLTHQTMSLLYFVSPTIITCGQVCVPFRFNDILTGRNVRKPKSALKYTHSSSEDTQQHGNP